MKSDRFFPATAVAAIALLTLGTATGWADAAVARGMPALVVSAFAQAATSACRLEFGHTCVVSDLERAEATPVSGRRMQ